MVSKKILTIGAVSALAMVATVADARHQWGRYAWAWDGSPLDIVIYNNTSGDWVSRVGVASSDWNVSKSINGEVKPGSNPNCDFLTARRIDVCNDDYGSVGWLGLASIQINGNEIVSGWSKMNDFYFDRDPPGSGYNTEVWRQLVMCQEIGHNYGLGHQNENFRSNATDSCMEYTSTPTTIDMTPDQHDFDQLEIMYPTSGGGGDSGDGGGGNGGGKDKPRGKPASLPSLGNTPDSWGRPIDYLPNGKPYMYERELNGYRVITHVTWTIEAAAELGDHHHGGGPRQHSGDLHF